MTNIFSPAFFLVNGLSLLILVFAFRRPLQAAKALALVFFLTAALNIIMLIRWPEVYLSLSAVAVFDWYVRTIDESFRSHLQIVVISISAAQVLIGLGLFKKGNVLAGALFCAMIFFWCVTPFGAGAFFPAPVVLSAACFVVLLNVNRKKRVKAIA